MKCLTTVVAGVFLAAALGYALKVELGATAGFGSFAAEDLSSRTFGVVGAEVCGFCSGRFALFGEYNHWLATDQNAAVRIKSADLAAGGLRIQGGQRVRPGSVFELRGQ